MFEGFRSRPGIQIACGLLAAGLLVTTAMLMIFITRDRRSDQAEYDRAIERLVSGLGTGMTLADFNRRIQQTGTMDPNSPPHAATCRYDFENFQIIVEATRESNAGAEGMRVKQILIGHDHLTVEQRKRKRAEEWSDYVSAHSGR